MEDNKSLLKQTYEYKWNFNQAMILIVALVLVYVPMCIFALRSQAVDSPGSAYMAIIALVFIGCIGYSFYKLKAILNHPETYARYSAKVIKARHFGKRWYLTLQVTKEDGTNFEIDSEKVFSFFGAKSMTDRDVSVLYDTVDGRLAIIKDI